MLKYLSPILLTGAIILATVAIILPNWFIYDIPPMPNAPTMADCNAGRALCLKSGQPLSKCDEFTKECTMDVRAGRGGVATAGLWSLCDNIDNKCETWSYTNTPTPKTSGVSLGPPKPEKSAPKDIVVSQVTSITGVVLLGIGMLCILMSKTLVSKLVIGLGVVCLTAALIVFGVVSKPDKMKDSKFNTSFWLEMSAAILGLITVFLPFKKIIVK